MNLLIADDEITSLVLLESLVKSLGYDFQSASNGYIALEKFYELKPEIILLDWNMPGFTGLELIELIRNAENEIEPYIIMITAKNEKESLEDALNKGADDYITKPFHPGELKARIGSGKRVIELQKDLYSKIKDLNNANSHITRLQELIPICMYCRKIRNDKETWEKIEEYLEKQPDVKLSHGICPDCMAKYHGDD